jgi:hypothetical protein
MEEEKKKLANQLQSLQYDRFQLRGLSGFSAHLACRAWSQTQQGNDVQQSGCRLSVEVEEENISNKLAKTMDTIKSEKEELLHRLEQEKAATAMLRKEHEQQRQELKKLQGSNYVMQQRISREHQRLSELQREKSHLAQVLEAEWERQLNVMLRTRTDMDTVPEMTKPDRTRSLNVDRTDDSLSDLPTDPPSWGGVDTDGDVVGELSLTPRICRDHKRRKCQAALGPACVCIRSAGRAANAFAATFS